MSFLQEIHRVQDEQLEFDRMYALSVLKDEILEAAKIGKKHLVLNPILSKDPSWNGVILKKNMLAAAKELAKEEGIEFESVFEGEDNRHENHGDLHRHVIRWT